MKTHTARLSLTTAIALIGLATVSPEAHCQVYSCNIVGYVNIVFTNGYRFIANTLDASPNNLLANVLTANPAEVPVGTRVYLWDVANQAWSDPSVFTDDGSGWSLNYDLCPGNGFVVYSPTMWTNTFLGSVALHTSSVFLAGSNRFSLVSRVMPVSMNLSNLVWLDPFVTSVSPWVDGENVYVFRTANQRYSDAFTYFDGYGWFDPRRIAGTNGPIIELAASFFVQNPNLDTNWVTTSSYCWTALQQAVSATANRGMRRINRIKLRAGIAALDISEAKAAYSVTWSSDGANWLTLAAGQSTNAWTGPVPLGSQGFFRLTQP